ncbi:MAG: adenylosuccinate lyase [Thermoplasmatales archaeon]|nr:adenylosuccinate lyase [Thermoplasmatales archaeon]
MICPLDYRYGKKEMKKIFSEENKLQKMLDVESALASALAKTGNIPKKEAEKILKKANTKYVKINRVKKIESEIKHDIMAMVKALTEASNSGYVHFGATSYDIVDTATALQLKDAIKIMEKDLSELKKSLLKLAKKHKGTIMLGRTHGQSAVPITFGLKLSVFATEIGRHIERLNEVKKRILVGKMMGAVGTGASFGKNALKIQSLVMKNLGLNTPEAVTQILQRDRHTEFVCLMGNISCSLEKFATEIRNLQRTEINEVAESFGKKQVGSSTMAHKKNPVTSEKICGLARIIRGFVGPCFESSILWHERDLTNSSSERFILPHVCVLTDEILQDMKNVFDNLAVYPENMMRNLEKSDRIMAESVMIALTKKGMNRQKAHELVRKCSMRKGVFKNILLREKEIRKLLSEKEINDALKPEKYIGCSEKIVENCMKEKI